MNKPIVTIITTTYKNFNGLEKTISSVMNQNYPKIEYIISDDGSDNFDYELISKLIEKKKKNNICNIQIIHHEDNYGTVKNINYASKIARGEYIIGIGLDDSFVSDNSITQIINRMEKDKIDILCFSRILCDFDDKPIRLMPCPTLYRTIKQREDYKKQYRAFVTGFHYEMASGSGVCSRKSFLEKMNYYDESYVYWEDGPYFAKCNMHKICIHNAYDIVAINYKKGGISSIKSKSPSKAVVGLRKDADAFYRKEYNKKSSYLSSYDKRILRYSIDRFRNKSKIQKSFTMINYIDVVLLRVLYRTKMRIASFLSSLIFNPNDY